MPAPFSRSISLALSIGAFLFRDAINVRARKKPNDCDNVWSLLKNLFHNDHIGQALMKRFCTLGKRLDVDGPLTQLPLPLHFYLQEDASSVWWAGLSRFSHNTCWPIWGLNNTADIVRFFFWTTRRCFTGHYGSDSLKHCDQFLLRVEQIALFFVAQLLWCSSSLKS